jgi:TATA-box binding protein (TBP) (component of TFIID and TFIIIB)
MRLDEPSASFILFRSGIVVVTDVSSETRARSALKALSKFLHAASLIG